jgi:Holliday junction resolvase RusA-like endonuclease
MGKEKITVEKYKEMRKKGEIKPFAENRKKYKIEYIGKVIGINNTYSMGWQKRHQQLGVIKNTFALLIHNAKIPRLKYMELRVYHNTRFDIDNLVAMIKPFVDMLRAKGVIQDDNKRFWDYLSISYDPTVKKKALLFIITGEDEGTE